MIYVLGNINNEITLEVARVPKKGEVLSADGYFTELGGKAALQALAIARLRGDVSNSKVKMIGVVGKDAAGEQLVSQLNGEGVDTEFVRKVNRSTGSAVTTITPKERRTILYDGANSGITKSDIDEALEHATQKDTLLCGLETPLYIVAYALRQARMIGMTTIFNPSPAKTLPDDIYYNVDIIVMSAQEMLMLTGINPQDYDSRRAAMIKMHLRGVPYVVASFGSRGVAMSDGARIVDHIMTNDYRFVDGSCADAAFVGGFTLTYPHIGMYSFREACRFAHLAEAITASKIGTVETIPTATDVYSAYIKEIE